MRIQEVIQPQSPEQQRIAASRQTVIVLAKHSKLSAIVNA